MLDRLEQARLIERRPNPDDRRGTLLVLTNERTAELDALFAPSRQAINELASSYSGTELEIITDYLEKLVQVWEEQRQQLKHLLEAKN
jgi:DNA-binding MarR family transcriptional regulator